MSTGGAIHSIITADASDYRAALATMESDTSRAVGRIGGMFKASTGGFREFSKGIASVGASFGTAFGAFHMGRAIRETFDVQEKINEAVVREVTLRDGLLRRIDEEKRSLRERLGIVDQRGANTSATESASGAITRDIENAEKRFDELEKQLYALRVYFVDDLPESIDAFGGSAIRAEMEQVTSTIEFLKGERSKVDAMRADAAAKDADAQKANDLRERMDRTQRADSIGRQLRIDGLRAEGKETEALKQAEHDRFLEQLQQITRLESASGARYDTMREKAESFHKSEMDRIGREAGERKRAMEQANKLSGMDLDAQEAALSGDKDRARALEEEIRKRRELEEIRRAPGLNDAERAARMAQVERISALRLADRDSARSMIESPTVSAGVQRSAAVLGQVFGGAGARDQAPAREQTQQKQLTLVGAIAQTLELIQTGGLNTIARFS